MNNFPHTYQKESNLCGPTCIEIIARYYKSYISQNHIANYCNINKDGCSINDVRLGLESIGLKSAAFECEIDQLKRIKLPIIAHLNTSHFIVIYKITNRTVYISDPQYGKYNQSVSLFEKKWIKNNSSGYIITAEPTINFKKHKFKSNNILNAFGFIWKYITPHNKAVLQVLTTLLIALIVQSILPFISKAVIDIGIKSSDLTLIKILLVSSITLTLFTGIANYIRSYLVLHVSNKIKISVQSDFLIKIMQLPFTFFENKLVGDIMQRIRDQERIQNFVMNTLLDFLLSIVTFLIFGLILFNFNVKLFWIFLLGSILYIVWILLFISQRKKLDINYFFHMGENNSKIISIFNSILDIKGYSLENQMKWDWEKTQIGLYNTNIKMLHITQLQDFGGNIINSIKNIALTFTSAFMVIEGQMSLGMLVATQYIIGNLNGPLSKMVNFFNGAQMAQMSYLRLNDIFNIPNDIADSQTINFFPKHKSLTVKNLSYKYKGNTNYALKNISLHLPYGNKVGVVGGSGSGKSTLLKILANLYKDYYGEVLIGSSNINNVSSEIFRKKLKYIFPDSKILRGNILFNVTLSKEDYCEDRFIMAIEAALIRREIEELQEGFMTIIGEDGKGLSSGQRQRILLARAIYANPDFLILDEATSALDSNKEQLILNKIDSILSDSLRIVVSHRIKSIINCDTIFVLQDGQIVEVGNHDKLIESKSFYYKLFKTQSLNEHSNKIITV